MKPASASLGYVKVAWKGVNSRLAAGAEHACKVGRLIGYVLSVVDRTWSLTHVSQAGTSLLFKSVRHKATLPISDVGCCSSSWSTLWEQEESLGTVDLATVQICV